MPNKPNKFSENADPFEQHNPVPKIVLALVMAAGGLGRLLYLRARTRR